MRRLWLLFVLLPIFLHAQWSTSPSQNTPIAVGNGDQVTSQIAVATDGSYYISWFDTRNGNYDVYMQRMSANGVPLWDVNGIVVSDNTADTYITGYDMVADHDNGAVASFQDIRSGSNDVYAYRLGDDQSFTWGDNGLALTDDENFDTNPTIAVTESNCAVIAWLKETDTNIVVQMQKISPTGELLWGASGITLSSPNMSYTRPHVVASTGENVIVAWYKQTGTFPGVTQNIAAQMFDTDGNPVWTNDAAITTTGAIPYFKDFKAISDNNGSAFYTWGDDRDGNNLLCSYVQGVHADGTLYWTDAVAASTSSNTNSFEPDIAYSPAGVYCFWELTNSNQDTFGFSGQLISLDGERMWGDLGHSYIGMSSTALSFPVVAAVGNNAIAGCAYYGFGDFVNASLRAVGVDTEGNPLWDGTLVNLCSVSSGKDDIYFAPFNHGQVVAVWTDDRNGNSDIYAQNISADGVLGPVSLNPALTIDSPANNAELHHQTAEIAFTATDFAIPSDGVLHCTITGPVTMDQYVETTSPIAFAGMTPGSYTATLELVDTNHQPLDPAVTATVNFSYVAPTIAITSPEEGAIITSLPFGVGFAVTNYVPGTDGLITYTLNGTVMGNLNTTEPIIINDIAAGEYTLTLELMDNTAHYTPNIIATLHFTYGVAVGDNNWPYDGPLAALGVYPNPAAQPGVNFAIAKNAPVTLSVYNLRGQLVQQTTQTFNSGKHVITWDGRDNRGRSTGSGVYLYRVEALGRVIEGKMARLAR